MAAQGLFPAAVATRRPSGHWDYHIDSDEAQEWITNYLTEKEKP